MHTKTASANQINLFTINLSPSRTMYKIQDIQIRTTKLFYQNQLEDKLKLIARNYNPFSFWILWNVMSKNSVISKPFASLKFKETLNQAMHRFIIGTQTQYICFTTRTSHSYSLTHKRFLGFSNLKSIFTCTSQLNCCEIQTMKWRYDTS